MSATFRLVRRDGRPCGSRPSCGSCATAGALVETHAILRDVDERVEAQRALAEAEERFRTAFEEGAAAWRSSSPRAASCASTARCARSPAISTAISRAARCSRCCTRTTASSTPGDRAMLAGRVATARGERRYLHDDGQVVWVAVSTTLVQDAAGRRGTS